uniref:hypothetical protein n=1 Tax=Streptomyces sp. NBC_01592 TaxID=2975889 RepID=UPI002F907BE2
MTIPSISIRRTTETGSNCFTNSELIPDTNPLGPRDSAEERYTTELPIVAIECGGPGTYRPAVPPTPAMRYIRADSDHDAQTSASPGRLPVAAPHRHRGLAAAAHI